MGKAREIIGLDCSADAFDGAKLVLQTRFEEVCRLREAALNFADIEGVHAMRVATRRLRSAMRDFAFLLKKRPLRQVRKDIKKLADALGSVRDLDVAIAALETLRETADTQEISDGIEKIIAEKRAFREKARLALSQALLPESLENLRQQFTAALAAVVRTDEKLSTLCFREAGREVISKSLQEFTSLSSALFNPFDIEKLHELRITAKRLRYAVELFTVCWENKIAPFAKEISKMQSFLGEVHDGDVWIEDLRQRLLKNHTENFLAETWLLSQFTKIRTKNYRDALNLWSNWQTTNFIETLKQTISKNTENQI